MPDCLLPTAWCLLHSGAGDAIELRLKPGALKHFPAFARDQRKIQGDSFADAARAIARGSFVDDPAQSLAQSGHVRADGPFLARRRDAAKIESVKRFDVFYVRPRGAREMAANPERRYTLEEYFELERTSIVSPKSSLPRTTS